MWQLWLSISFMQIEKCHYQLFPTAFETVACNMQLFSHGFATSLENLIKENKLCKLTLYKVNCLCNKNYRLLLVGNFYPWLTQTTIFSSQKGYSQPPILSLIPRDHSINDPDVPESENRLYPGRSLSLFPTISLSPSKSSLSIVQKKSRLGKFVNGTNRYYTQALLQKMQNFTDRAREAG